MFAIIFQNFSNTENTEKLLSPDFQPPKESITKALQIEQWQH